MSGFFSVTDLTHRRVVRYERVSSTATGAVFIGDETVLGAPVDDMPYVDKTGIVVKTAGIVYELPYLPDVGDVYFSLQPVDGKVGDILMVEVKAGTAPYDFQWYKDDKQVIDLATADNEVTASKPGNYWCVVTDADGVQKVSQSSKVE